MDSFSQTTASAAAVTGGGKGAMVHPSNDASPMESFATTVAAAGIPTDDPKQNLTQVINSIQKNLGILHQLYLTVSSFNVASQLPLLQRMNNLVLELDNMTRLAKTVTFRCPWMFLNDGKNPDKFTQDMLNGCIAKNQITKGKRDSFKLSSLHNMPISFIATFNSQPVSLSLNLHFRREVRDEELHELQALLGVLQRVNLIEGAEDVRV